MSTNVRRSNGGIYLIKDCYLQEINRVASSKSYPPSFIPIRSSTFDRPEDVFRPATAVIGPLEGTIVPQDFTM